MKILVTLVLATLLALVLVLVLVSTDFGAVLLWKMNLRAIDAIQLTSYRVSTENLPELVGKRIDRVQLSVRGIIPISGDKSRSYYLKDALPDCTTFYWLGMSPILIGVKNGLVLHATMLKG